MQLAHCIDVIETMIITALKVMRSCDTVKEIGSNMHEVELQDNMTCRIPSFAGLAKYANYDKCVIDVKVGGKN